MNQHSSPSPAVTEAPPQLVHLLVVNLGSGRAATPTGYEETTYTFGDGPSARSYRATVAGLALWRWLQDTDRPPTRVLFACTPSAWKEKAGAVEDEARHLALGWEHAEQRDLEIPRSQEQVWAMLQPLEEWIKQHGVGAGHKAVLHFDLTNAYRAIPIAQTWMALYLQRRGLVSPGVWGYGAFEPGKQETPFLDLAHLLSLADWAEAVASFRDRFDTAGLTRLLEPLERSARRSAAVPGGPKPRNELRALLRAAHDAGEAFRAGLPLEVGLEVQTHLGKLSAAAVRDAAAELAPPHELLAEELFQSLQPLAAPATAKGDRKRQLPLDRAEIRRQLHLVERWVRAGMFDAALRALRELMVTRVLLAWGSKPGEWLRQQRRTSAEGRLHGLASRPAPRPLSPSEARLAKLWNHVRERRNPLAHAGMEENEVKLPGTRQALEKDLLPAFRALDSDDEVWRLEGIPEPREGEGGR
jgi:hypothetical protein